MKCRWCGGACVEDKPCVFEALAHAFYDAYFVQLGRPDITWETFALTDHVLFSTAMRVAVEANGGLP